jgi:hypothetical protein
MPFGLLFSCSLSGEMMSGFLFKLCTMTCPQQAPCMGHPNHLWCRQLSEALLVEELEHSSSLLQDASALLVHI